VRKRRTKAELDPGILEKVLTVIAVGAGRKAAAQQAGISEETLRAYERMGRDAWGRREAALLEGVDPELDPRDRLFADFFERLQKAESKTKVYLLGVLQKASGGDWRAGAWLLERLYPGDYGPRVDVNAKHSGELTQRLDLSKLSDDDLWRLRQIQKKLSEGKKTDYR